MAGGGFTIRAIGASEGIRIGRAYRLDAPNAGAAAGDAERAAPERAGEAAGGGAARAAREGARMAEPNAQAAAGRSSEGGAAPHAGARAPSGAGPQGAEAELARLALARDRSAAQLEELAARAKETLGEDKAAILLGQRGFLSDPAFYPPIEKRVREEGQSAEEAVREAVEHFAARFEAMNNAYMRERAADIRDVGKRLLDALSGGDSGEAGIAGLREEAILVAEDLSPSETVQLDKRLVLAVVTRAGGRTSHTAILSRSLGIPAVVGAGEPLDAVRTGDTLIVDGSAGLCIVRPDEATLREYEARMAAERERLEAERGARFRPAVSADGRRVEIGANIGTVAEAEAAADSGADGIGLYRTEFLFMHANRLPDEEEQYRAYREVVERMGGQPVIIRTLDIGGDKALTYLDLPQEANPFLGYRAIRIGLDREDWLRTQLRAIARASAHGPVKVMFPMISGLGEWRRAKAIFAEELDGLRRANVPHAERIETGIMVEIPSAALQADAFAREVDFFSIGTNDLVQYTLAVDRMNERVAGLYDYFHPAVLRLIRSVIEASHRHGRWTGMCGGMAGDPLAAPLLLGFGLDEWSMDIGSIPKVKSALARLSSASCQELADRAVDLDTPEAVREALQAFFGEIR